MLFSQFLEKWSGDNEIEQTGEWTNYSVSELESKAAALRNKEERSEAESKRLKQINFAIRAKKAGGKKWKGVKAS